MEEDIHWNHFYWFMVLNIDSEQKWREGNQISCGLLEWRKFAHAPVLHQKIW
jgi:hypothetical protein